MLRVTATQPQDTMGNNSSHRVWIDAVGGTLNIIQRQLKYQTCWEESLVKHATPPEN